MENRIEHAIRHSVNNVLDEIGILINKYNVKEIFDDSGTLMTGKWLTDLCNEIIKRGYNKKIKYSCNMRFGALKQEDYNLMKKAGFRLLKFGLESANQKTLDRLNKGIKVGDIINGCRMAKKAGLTVHLTMIVGYPWETKQDALKTFELAKKLMQSGDANLLQATVLIPYPGTPLFEECKNKDLLYSLDWSYYDMKNPVMKINYSSQELSSLVQGMYSVSFDPEFILRKIISIRSFDDIKYFWRAFLKVAGHIIDFKKKKHEHKK